MIRDPRVQHYLERLRPERDALMAEMEALARTERIPIVEWETGQLLATLVAASKTEIDDYLGLLDGRLAPRALLVVDNLLMSGEAALPEGLETAWSEDSLAAARRFTRAMTTSPEWLFSLLPV